MRVRTARTLLSATWVIASIPLILIVTLQSLLEVFGTDWDKPWAWLVQLLFPILGIVVGVWSVSDSESETVQIASTVVFWGTMLLSLCYIAMIYLTIGVGAFYYQHKNWDFIMKSTSLFFGPFQAIVTTAMAKFFLETVHFQKNVKDMSGNTL